jgi:hypothetical protein
MCYWLAPEAAAASELTLPVAAGLFIIVPLAPDVAPASVLLSARLHPDAPIASSTTDAAIAKCFLASFIARSSWNYLQAGSGHRNTAPQTSAGQSNARKLHALRDALSNR